MLTNSFMLITGGTGSFGHSFVRMAIDTLRGWIDARREKYGLI